MLPDPQIRQELSALSGWPTIPQVFIKGELVGGADIVEELHASGELQQRLDEALGTERERDGQDRRSLTAPSCHRASPIGRFPPNGLGPSTQYGSTLGMSHIGFRCVVRDRTMHA